MGGAPLLVVLAAVGIVGAPTQDSRGGYEFTMKAYRKDLVIIESGNPVSSAVPEDVKGKVHQFVFQIVPGKPADLFPSTREKTLLQPAIESLANVMPSTGYMPDGKGGLDYIVQVTPEEWSTVKARGGFRVQIEPQISPYINRFFFRIGEQRVDRKLPSQMAQEDRSLITQTSDGDSYAALRESKRLEEAQFKSNSSSKPFPSTSENRTPSNFEENALASNKTAPPDPRLSNQTIPSNEKRLGDYQDNLANTRVNARSRGQAGQNFTEGPQSRGDSTVEQGYAVNPEFNKGRPLTYGSPSQTQQPRVRTSAFPSNSLRRSQNPNASYASQSVNPLNQTRPQQPRDYGNRQGYSNNQRSGPNSSNSSLFNQRDTHPQTRTDPNLIPQRNQRSNHGYDEPNRRYSNNNTSPQSSSVPRQDPASAYDRNHDYERTAPASNTRYVNSPHAGQLPPRREPLTPPPLKQSLQESSTHPPDYRLASRRQDSLGGTEARRKEVRISHDANEGVIQPVFNFLLLISIVANAYMVVNISRLLQRYRAMVSNLRTASAHSANG